MRLCVIAALLPAALAQAQTPSTIRVAEPAWLDLEPPERDILSQRYLVNIFPAQSAGTITDAQTINESTPGTTAGSQLGAAYGSAAYVDRAFRGPRYNYSATNNITAALAGALIGGALLDQPGRAQFHTRYAIRTLDGQIQYRDEVKGDAFRHSVGICVSVASMQPIDQAICNQTPDTIRRQHLAQAAAPPPPPTPEPRPAVDAAPLTLEIIAAETDNFVRCKFGSNPPVMIARTTCENAKGEVR
jgi:hypothetical protein